MPYRYPPEARHSVGSVTCAAVGKGAAPVSGRIRAGQSVRISYGEAAGRDSALFLPCPDLTEWGIAQNPQFLGRDPLVVAAGSLGGRTPVVWR